jgi:hypothetical protein
MKRQVVPVVTISTAAHLALAVMMQHRLAHRASTKTKRQFVPHALSVKKFMHRSLVCHAKKFQQNA